MVENTRETRNKGRIGYLEK